MSDNTEPTDPTGSTDADTGTPDEYATAPRSPEELTSDSPFTLPGFFTALGEGSLLAAACEDCGTRLIPPRPACYDCGSRDLQIERQPRPRPTSWRWPSPTNASGRSTSSIPR